MTAIDRGREIYTSLAERTGIPIDDAFLAALGTDEVAAIIEARQHFDLPPFE